MNEPNSFWPIKMLVEWQGQAILAPGVFLDQKQEDQLAESGDAAAIADWLAVSALSAAFERGEYPARKARILEILNACRERCGGGKIEEVKRELLRRVQENNGRAKVPLAEMNRRIESLFSDLK